MSYQRRTNGSLHRPTIHDLEAIAEANSPETLADIGVHHPFVSYWEEDVLDDEQRWIMVWTTKHLASLQAHSQLLQVDGTYNLDTEGFILMA